MPKYPITVPENLSTKPDKDTKKGLKDFTSDHADERVLRINLGFFKYGTDDKTHAAAIVLSLLLFIAIIGVIIAGMFTSSTAWPEKTFNWLGGAFLLISGIAIGRSESKNKKQKIDEDD